MKEEEPSKLCQNIPLKTTRRISSPPNQDRAEAEKDSQTQHPNLLAWMAALVCAARPIIEEALVSGRLEFSTIMEAVIFI